MHSRLVRPFCATLAFGLLISSLGAQIANGALEVGDDAVLRVPQHASLEPTGGLTIECWIKARGSISHGRIIRKSRDFQPGYHLSFSYQGTRVGSDLYALGQSYQVNDSSSNTTYIGAWHHLAVTVLPSSQMKLYIDGVLVASSAAPPVLQHSDALVIGGFQIAATNIQEEFLGLVDEVRIWNVVRTREDIAADRFRYLRGGNGLVSYWHFDGDTQDAVGGNHGTLVGAASLVPSDCPVLQNFSVTPAEGRWTGGSTVDLRGIFPTELPGSLTFGEYASPSYSFVQPDLLRAVVPHGAAGERVLVIAHYPNSDLFGTSRFAFLPRLDLPASASLGSPVTLRLSIPPQGHTILFAGLPPAIRVALPPFEGALGVMPPFVEILSTPVPFSTLELALLLPPDPQLAGLELLVQALFAPSSGSPAGTFVNLERFLITP